MILRLRNAAHYLRLAPFDTGTAEGRAAERYRRAAWASISNLLSRGLSMVLIVLGVSLTTAYLGKTRFGVWATFASMVAMLSLLDLGLGNALVNRVAHASTRSDPSDLRSIVSGGAGILGVVGLLAALGLSVLAAVVPWGTAFHLQDPALADEARAAAQVFALLFGLNLWGSGLIRVLAGQQRAHEANLLSASATALACVALVAAAARQASVPWLLLATFGAQSLAGVAAAVLLARRRLLAGHGIGAAMRAERGHLLHTGAMFVMLQIGTMLGWASDSVILSTLRGAGEAAVYAVAMRLFQFVSQPIAVLNTPLWAAYADAAARGDSRFVRTTLRRSLLGSLAAGAILSVMLALLGRWIIEGWTRETIAVPQIVLVLFALWTTLEVSGNAFGTYLNGCGILRPQLVVVLTFCVVVVPLKIWFASVWGTAGVLGAGILGYVVVIVGLYGLVFRHRLLEPTRAAP